MEEVEFFVDSVQPMRPVSDQKLDQLREATAADKQLQLAMKYRRQGWPEHYKDIPDQMTEFYAA